MESLGCLDIVEELIEKMMEDVFYSDVAQRVIVQTFAVIDNVNANFKPYSTFWRMKTLRQMKGLWSLKGLATTDKWGKCAVSVASTNVQKKESLVKETLNA